MAATREPEQHRLLGGRLCLDFTNTLDGRGGTAPEEFLPDYDALVRWAWYAGALAPERAERLRQVGACHPAEARRVLQRAGALREALYAVFAAATHGEAALARDLALVNRELAEAMRQARLLPAAAAAGSGYRWDWPEEDATERPDDAKEILASVLWPIVRSAAELLIAPELALVKKCPGINCGWLFLDTSKNHRRQWCSMATCGNRTKARRHYSQQRSSRE